MSSEEPSRKEAAREEIKFVWRTITGELSRHLLTALLVGAAFFSIQALISVEVRKSIVSEWIEKGVAYGVLIELLAFTLPVLFTAYTAIQFEVLKRKKRKQILLKKLQEHEEEFYARLKQDIAYLLREKQISNVG